jgi:hypothetical protein
MKTPEHQPSQKFHYTQNISGLLRRGNVYNNLIRKPGGKSSFG